MKPFLQEQIKTQFMAYDSGLKGYLNNIDFTQMISDIRQELGFDKCDEDLVNKILQHMSKHKDCCEKIYFAEYAQRIDSILKIIADPGLKANSIVQKIFQDFEVDEKKGLYKNELKIQLNFFCDKVHIERPGIIKVNYQLTFFDMSGAGIIHYPEFIMSFSIAYLELVRNFTNKKKKIHQKSNLLRAFNMNEQTKEHFVEELVIHTKNLLVRFKNTELDKLAEKKIKKNYDILSVFSNSQNKKVIPIENLLCSIPAMKDFQIKNVSERTIRIPKVESEKCINQKPNIEKSSFSQRKISTLFKEPEETPVNDDKYYYIKKLANLLEEDNAKITSKRLSKLYTNKVNEERSLSKIDCQSEQNDSQIFTNSPKMNQSLSNLVSECVTDRNSTNKPELKIMTKKLSIEQIQALKTLCDKQFTSTQRKKIINKDKVDFANICNSNVKCSESSVLNKEYIHFNEILNKFNILLDSKDLEIKTGVKLFEDYKLEELFQVSTAVKNFREIILKSLNKIESFMQHLKKFTVKSIKHFEATNVHEAYLDNISSKNISILKSTLNNLKQNSLPNKFGMNQIGKSNLFNLSNSNNVSFNCSMGNLKSPAEKNNTLSKSQFIQSQLNDNQDQLNETQTRKSDFANFTNVITTFQTPFKTQASNFKIRNLSKSATSSGKNSELNSPKVRINHKHFNKIVTIGGVNQSVKMQSSFYSGIDQKNMVNKD